jgi:hypothetical protein
MMNRSFVASALASAALLVAGVGLCGRSAEAAKPKKPSIGTATLSPKRLSAQGGSVSIRVKIKNNGSSISSVAATSTLSGGTESAAATLQASGTDTYTGTVRVSANTRTKKTTASIYVQVNSTNGVVSKKVGTIQVDPGNGNTGGDTTPPPPPNI